MGVTVGGSALTLMRGQLRWFRQRGWDVTLLCAPGEASDRAASLEGVSLETVPMERNISPLKDVVALVRWIRLLRKLRPDAVNVGTPKAGLLGSMAAWATRVRRRLYVVRGLRVEGETGIKAKVIWLSERISMAAATDVLYVSRSLAREAERRGLMDVSKSWLILEGSSNGVDADAVAARAARADGLALRKEAGFSAGHFVVGFVGRITRDKGLETVLAAAQDGRLASHVRFLVLGSAEDRALAERLQAHGDRIFVVGYTSDVWGYFAAMDALCLPTRREGFPNVVLEAAAAGVPTVTTRATGAVDSVIEMETGLLMDIDAPDQLVDHINLLANDAHLCRRLAMAARDRARTTFRPEAIWLGVEEILSGTTTPAHATKVAGSLKEQR